MSPTCQTCGATPEAARLLRLSELGFGPAHQGLAIQLCDSCLGEREVRAWSSNEAEHDPLIHALEQRHSPPQDRYTYLQDPEETVHLLRLRPDWVDRHAVERQLGQA